MDLIMDKVFVDPSPYGDEILNIAIPPDQSSQYEHPDKEDFIASLHVFPGRQEAPIVSEVPLLPVSSSQGSSSSQNFCRLNSYLIVKN